MPKERVNWFRQSYGVRGPDGQINGSINWGLFGKDASRWLAVALLFAILMGIIDAWNWYKLNQALPEKFEKHVSAQIETEKKLAEDIGEIKEGIRDLRRRDR